MPCPLFKTAPHCNADNCGPLLIRRVNPSDIVSRWYKELGVALEDGFTKIEKIEHWRCTRTGFEWYTPSNISGGEQLYRQLERYEWYYMPDKWEFRRSLKYMTSGEKLLEIGSGAGHFLKMARGHGMTASGLEMNPSAAELARKCGFTIYGEKLDQLQNPLGSSFDVICAFQVLEHVPDPNNFLQHLIGLLRPRGKLILSVPNAAVLRVVDPKYHSLLNQPPHHVTHWDENVFRALSEFFPLRILDICREPLQRYHAAWFVRSFLRRPFNELSGNILINNFTIAPITLLLMSGVRFFIPGHTLLLVFEKEYA